MASFDNLLARYDAARSIGEKAAIWQEAADAQQRGEITWQQFTVIHQAYTKDSGRAIGGPLTHEPAYSTSGGGNTVPMANIDTSGGGNTVPTNNPYLYETNPEAYYRQQLGIPDIGQNPYYEWLANQFGPTQAAYLGQSSLAGLQAMANQSTSPAAPYRNFAAYLAGPGIMGAREAAGNILTGVRSLPWNLAQEFGTAKTTGGWGIGEGNLEQLLGSALGQKMGFPMGNMAGAAASTMAPGFAASLQANPNQSFLGYLMAKYGL